MADDMLRTCRKTGCRWPAAASLSYRYDTGQVWLLDLIAEAHPSLYDLCPHHADSLTVPQGWELVDQRTQREAVREPAGRELTDGEHAPPGAGGYEGNRYAELSAKLPELAREVASNGEEPADGAEGVEEPQAASPSPAPAPVRAESHPIPSRDLAPVPIGQQVADASAGQDATPDATPGATPDATPEAAEDAAEGDDAGQREAESAGEHSAPHVHEGQLAIPVDDGEDDGDDAVVVSIEHAGSRRRAPSRA